MTAEQGHAEIGSELLRQVNVIMPIGGLATRAQPVTGDAIPKHLIRLGNGKTVLDTITGGLQRVGFRDFVFCLGHHSDQLRDHIEGGAWRSSDEITFRYSTEDKPLGVDGAVVKAIGEFGLTGQAMVIPGDIVLPWQSAAIMNINHAGNGADVTIGVTSHITPRTTDVGKIVGEADTNRLLWCYARETPEAPQLPGAENLTSAAAVVISIEQYVELCTAYRVSNPQAEGLPMCMRDNILPWIAAAHPDFNVRLYDIRGEMLDIGTPEKIQYGKENWRDYV